MFVITKGRGKTPLNNIWDTEFCCGTKCVDVSNTCYTIFETKDDAQKYLDRKLVYLDEWINNDIPQQATKWSDNTRHEFLNRSKEHYDAIKKMITNMKIVEHHINN
jgi:hypothetical protein